MKLIYANGACSLAVHILLEELGVPCEAIRVDLKDKKVLESYNPLGYVPVLVLDNGETMCEATSLLQFLSIENGSSFLPQIKHERAKCIEWLTFISTELHKGAGPLFHRSGLKEDYLNEILTKVDKRLQVLEDHLQESTFIMGEQYTVADMYALAILRILEHVKISFDSFDAIKIYKQKLEESTVIKKVLEIEAKAPLETQVRKEIRPYSSQTDTGSSVSDFV